MGLGQGLGFLSDRGRWVIPLSTAMMMMMMMMMILAGKKIILLVLGGESGNPITM